MSLELKTFIDLPEHIQAGGFDHAAVHQQDGRLYVAHTANDSLDVIDCLADRYLHSIPDLKGIAGALVSEERGLVFTSNRGENSVGIFTPSSEPALVKVPVGIGPNGLAFAPQHNLLLVANVGDTNTPGSHTLSVVDIGLRKIVASIEVAGRTRWAVFDPQTQAFHVNIADPPQVVRVSAAKPNRVANAFPVPAVGPHGLDLDVDRRLLYCACDNGNLLALDIQSGAVRAELDLSGPPDVIFFNEALRHLYVAIGEPGVIDVFDMTTDTLTEVVSTEKGAHTIAFDAKRNKVYAFLPDTHRAATYLDTGS
jgi:DNA-binding beta-propeller fold protein YncE